MERIRRIKITASIGLAVMAITACRAAQDGEPDVQASTTVRADQVGGASDNALPDRPTPPPGVPSTHRAVLDTNLPGTLIPIVDGQLKPLIEAPTPAARRFDTVTLGLIVSDKTYFRGYKNAQKQGSLPSADTMFEIGSQTKTVTALAVLELIRAGKLSLDTPVKAILTDMAIPAYQGEPILVRHLLAHSSGLPRLPGDLEAGTQAYADYEAERLKTLLATTTLAAKPGSAWEESEVGYALLGMMVAKLENKSVESALKTLVTQKLGMDDATIKLTPSQNTRLVRGFHNGAPATLSSFSEIFAGAAALRASTRDLARLLQAEMGLIETPLFESIQKSHESLFMGTEEAWGAGLGQRVLSGKKVFFMKSSSVNASSYLAFVPEKKLGAIVLTNNSFSDSGGMDSRVEEAVTAALTQILGMLEP